MSGCSHMFKGATADSTVGDVRSFIAPLLRVPASRVLLVQSGQQLKDDAVTLLSLGLSGSSDPPFIDPTFIVYALLKFKAPDALFDGLPHPFGLNGLAIGGDWLGNEESEAPLQSPPSQRYTLGSFASGLAECASSGKAAPFVTATALLQGDERDSDETAVAPENGSAKKTLESQLLAIESANGVTIPRCVKALLTNAALRKACFTHLGCNPLVCDDFSEERAAICDSPFYVRAAEDKACVLFMGDHQGCCYWYAVWDPSKEQKAEERNDQTSIPLEIGAEGVSVYVLFGGQEFDIGTTAYLTSANFWRFLSDYAKLTAAGASSVA